MNRYGIIGVCVVGFMLGALSWHRSCIQEYETQKRISVLESAVREPTIREAKPAAPSQVLGKPGVFVHDQFGNRMRAK